MKFEQHQLSSGLQVVTETNPHVHSMAAGFFVRTGSRDETPTVSGVSHFLEHMAFKGNDKYSADDVNRIFDEIGARYNASTSEEVTMYYAAVLPEYLETAMQMLACLMMPSLRQDDFDMEKNVILEEIGMYADQPAFTCYDHAMATHFQGHPLGSSILGSEASITALTSEQMRVYHREHYHTGNITLAVTGNFDVDTLLSVCESCCAEIPQGKPDRILAGVECRQRQQLVTREGNVQEHLMLMGNAPAARDSLRFAAELLAVIVGDDSGSRLYWELVDSGAVEAAELSFNEYDGVGSWLTYVCCQPDQVAKNIAAVKKVYDAVNAEGVTDEELERARNKVASRIVLRSERPMGRLSSLGGNWLYRGEYRAADADLAAVRGVTTDDIRTLLEKYPLHMSTTTGVGPLTELNAN
jgi:predicted Zn-dependent peptidase